MLERTEQKWCYVILPPAVNRTACVLCFFSYIVCYWETNCYAVQALQHLSGRPTQKPRPLIANEHQLASSGWTSVASTTRLQHCHQPIIKGFSKTSSMFLPTETMRDHEYCYLEPLSFEIKQQIVDTVILTSPWRVDTSLMVTLRVSQGEERG